jgi:hypothetical protein
VAQQSPGTKERLVNVVGAAVDRADDLEAEEISQHPVGEVEDGADLFAIIGIANSGHRLNFSSRVLSAIKRGVGPWLAHLPAHSTRMNTILLPPEPPVTTAPTSHQRTTDLSKVLFPVEMRPLHFLGDDDQPVILGSHRAVITMQTQAGRWLREFDELLKANPKPDIAEYLGEYGSVAQRN